MKKTDKTYNEIKNRLLEHYWKPGEKITSERDLSILLNVSRVTIKTALNKLLEEGLLEYKEGKRGTFVSNNQNNNNKAKTICVAIDNKTPAFSSFLLEGIHDTLLDKGFHTLYFNTLFNKGNILDQINEIISNNISGFIFAPLMGSYNRENNEKIINLLIKNNIPLVQVDRFVTEDYGSYVGTNNTKAFYNLTKTLINKGYKSFLTVSGYYTSSSKERIIGIKKALRESELDFNQISINEIDYVMENKVSFTNEEKNFINNSEVIIGLNQNLCNAVKQYNNTKYMASSSASKEECENNIATIQPMYEIGKESGRIIIDSINNKNYIQRKVQIGGYLYEK